jgi:hypothetical protein
MRGQDEFSPGGYIQEGKQGVKEKDRESKKTRARNELPNRRETKPAQDPPKTKKADGKSRGLKGITP